MQTVATFLTYHGHLSDDMLLETYEALDAHLLRGHRKAYFLSGLTRDELSRYYRSVQREVITRGLL